MVACGILRLDTPLWEKITLSELAEELATTAEDIVNTLTQTVYQFAEHIDVARGVYDCDCNGFVGHVLKTVAPDHYALIPREADQLRPRAFEYFDFFASLTPESVGGWDRIDRLADAGRGDIVCWRFPEIRTGHNTGHVLYLAETPRMQQDGSFQVRIYDSAAQAHFDDTRATGKFPTGVGTGFLNFRVDGEGRPIAFQFGPGEEFETFPIAVGRIEVRL